MSSECGIYAIANTQNGMVYVGLTERSFERRWAEQRKALNSGKHCTAKLLKDWQLFGESAFDFQVLEVLPADSPWQMFLIRERYYMSMYLGRIYNRNGPGKLFGQYTGVLWFLNHQD